jgi:hypothetical protein
VFYPLGYPVRIATKSPEVLDAAEASWSHWRPLFDVEPIDLAVCVDDRGDAATSSEFAYARGMIRFVADGANNGWFSAGRRRGSLRVAAGTVRDTAVFRYRFLEALVMTALDTLAFTPVHAACVAQGGSGILLCGDSGAGKSSFTYACAKAGWTVVSDDAAHLVRGSRGALVGDPRRIYLREPARLLFPELSDVVMKSQPNGKAALEIDAAHRFMTCETSVAHQAVFLLRRSGPARIRPYPRDEALDYFRRYVPWRSDASSLADFESAISSGCWRLEYGTLDGAVAVLASLMRASAA